MPRVQGLEVLRQFNSDAPLRRISTVVLMLSRAQGDVTRSCESGANARVVKPINSEEFLGTVHALGVFWAELDPAPPSH